MKAAVVCHCLFTFHHSEMFPLNHPQSLLQALPGMPTLPLFTGTLHELGGDTVASVLQQCKQEHKEVFGKSC